MPTTSETVFAILVVDDEPDARTILRSELERVAGVTLKVSTAANGDEALDKLKDDPFDLVFLDLKLPDIPGDELYAKLKDMHPDMPIVIITGYPDSEILSKILASGPVTVIKKPIEFEQLNRTVKILGHKGAGQEANAKA